MCIMCHRCEKCEFYTNFLPQNLKGNGVHLGDLGVRGRTT
jgi:hypothetical protein